MAAGVIGHFGGAHDIDELIHLLDDPAADERIDIDHDGHARKFRAVDGAFELR